MRIKKYCITLILLLFGTVVAYSQEDCMGMDNDSSFCIDEDFVNSDTLKKSIPTNEEVTLLIYSLHVPALKAIEKYKDEFSYSETACFEKLGIDLGVVINLTIPEEILRNRILGRRTCKDCGSIYKITNEEVKPKVDGICDKCGGELYQRDDDNEESMNTRVKTYFEVTAPIIDYYKEKGVLKTVDSSREIELTFEEIEKILMSEDVDN